MRLFVGIPLPEPVEQRLRALIDELQRLAAVKWIGSGGMHLTLKFIGEEVAERLPEIRHALETSCERAPFELVMRGVGWFPNARAPRVFWAGAERHAALSDLARDIDSALSALGIPRELRAYAPHVTLARIPDGAGIERLRKHVAAAPAPEFGAFPIDHFVLYESSSARDPATGRSMHEHRAVETFALRAAASGPPE